ncbi:hypothetical protein [Polycladidibacter hongkongensis]|uniref:hypothetical protein n=1 Tax=Polycladidibacter hongkongensis TaxID=1647556 RepID=UPI000830A031|nr:hypothetical protein [Pseudovibrio hongkongensis]
MEKGSVICLIKLSGNRAELQQETNIAKETKAWLAGGAADQIKAYVSKMVIVMPVEEYQANKRASVEAVFGVSGGMFPSVQTALAWIEKDCPAVSSLESLSKYLSNDLRLV